MISLSWSMTVACISAIALLMVVPFRGRDERERETVPPGWGGRIRAQSFLS